MSPAHTFVPFDVGPTFGFDDSEKPLALINVTGRRGRARPVRRRFGPADLPAMLASPPTEDQTPRVLLAGKLTALSAPGGGETQMFATARMLPDVGIDARMWRPWEDALGEFDALHLFGSLPEHLAVVDAAKRAGVPIALSTIAWFDLSSLWHEPRPIWRRLAAMTKHTARAIVPHMPSWRRRLYQAVDRLLPNSQAEAEQLMLYFGVPQDRIHVVPNGADARFARATPDEFHQRFDCRNFALYVGRIEPRKNQLGFLQAMRGCDCPIVILGDVVPGHEEYLAECRAAAGPQVQFIDGIRHHDALLASAYAACGCLVLVSRFETPGLVALEAGMSGVPLVLTTRGCTREYFGGWAEYVEPDDHPAIRKLVLAALDRPRSAEMAQFIRRRYSWRAAAEATRHAYQGLWGK